MNDHDEINLTLEEPTLTLNPEKEEMTEVLMPEAATEEQAVRVFDDTTLSPKEKEMVDNFVKTIDITDSAVVMQYGVGAQKKIANFSETALENVQSKDLGEVGQMLSSMVVELQNFDVDEEEKKGFFGFFKKQTNKVAALKAKYATTETNINSICQVLEHHQIQLMKDMAMLDKLYEANLSYFKELSMYILAGKKKLDQAKNVELPELIAKSEQSGLPQDAQAARDYSDMCNRFEKKIYDLELTRTISLQMAPQIRLVQNNDTLMAEKIQSSLVNTIPLWKSQMVLALGIAHSGEAAKAQHEVTDMTNQLLQKNADLLKMETINTAKESERGIVDIETLKHTNESLISTFDEVLTIQQEGQQKRKEAEAELQVIENDLKKKLLEASKRK